MLQKQNIASLGKMERSLTQLNLYQINQEIRTIVKSQHQNDTSYFPNHEKLLLTFQNYLKNIQSPQSQYVSGINLNVEGTIFKEQIKVSFWLKCKRLAHVLLTFGLVFSEELRRMSTKDLSPKDDFLIALKDYSIVEVVFLTYLSLQIQRKNTISKDSQKDAKKNMFLLKQVIKHLGSFIQYNQNQMHTLERQDTFGKFSPFSINEDKLIKVIFIKTQKIKLEREDYQKNYLKYQTRLFEVGKNQYFNPSSQGLLESSKNQEQALLQNNFSLISIKSQYQQSRVYTEDMKRSFIIKNLIKQNYNHEQNIIKSQTHTKEQIFQYYSLNELGGYIKE